MARHIGWAIVMLLASGPVHGTTVPGPQPEHGPQQSEQTVGKQDHRRDNQDRRSWWKNPRDVAEIGLTAEQSSQIERIFRSEIDKMKRMRTEVNELERGVDAAMRASTADIEAFARQVEQVERKRAELNKTRTVMLYRIHRVLTPDQHTRFKAMSERREAERKDTDRHR